MTIDAQTRARLLAAIEKWESRFTLEGSECPLPSTLMEDEYPDLFDAMGVVLEHAALLHATEFMAAHPNHRDARWIDGEYFSAEQMYLEDFQGYHDEWPPVLAAAKEILKTKEAGCAT